MFPQANLPSSDHHGAAMPFLTGLVVTHSKVPVVTTVGVVVHSRSRGESPPLPLMILPVPGQRYSQAVLSLVQLLFNCALIDQNLNGDETFS